MAASGGRPGRPPRATGKTGILRSAELARLLAGRGAGVVLAVGQQHDGQHLPAARSAGLLGLGERGGEVGERRRRLAGSAGGSREQGPRAGRASSPSRRGSTPHSSTECFWARASSSPRPCFCSTRRATSARVRGVGLAAGVLIGLAALGDDLLPARTAAGRPRRR